MFFLFNPACVKLCVSHCQAIIIVHWLPPYCLERIMQWSCSTEVFLFSLSTPALGATFLQLPIQEVSLYCIYRHGKLRLGRPLAPLIESLPVVF